MPLLCGDAAAGGGGKERGRQGNAFLNHCQPNPSLHCVAQAQETTDLTHGPGEANIGLGSRMHKQGGGTYLDPNC